MRAYASDFPFSLLIFLVLIVVLIVPKKQQTIYAHSIRLPMPVNSSAHRIVRMARHEAKPRVHFFVADTPHPRVRLVAENHNNPTVPHHHILREIITHEAKSLVAPLAPKRLVAMVLERNPRRGKSYARQIASLITRNARAAHLPVAAVAATAAIESDFNMHSGPCIGMMQLSAATFRERHAKSGLDPHALSDNIRLGVRELAYHYKRTSHRSSTRARLAMMWGHYNGAGSHSKYVRRAFRVYDEM